MIRLLGRADEWAGEMPAVLVAIAADEAGRRDALRRLAARVLGCVPDHVDVRHRPGEPPRLVRLPGVGLHLSSASRGGVAALAVADRPVGLDVEAVVPGLAPPWNVLHPDEREWLAGLAPAGRPHAFARLWSVKEAYLKALGCGLARAPETFAVDPAGPDRATVRDGDRTATASTSWIGADRSHALSLVVLPPAGPTIGPRQA